MPVILVANPKGGVGKSTLSTNIAGFYASRGYSVMLGDTDKQQSARNWLQLRPANVYPIGTWEIDADNIARPPKGVSHVVLDSPAGVHGWRLKELLRMVNKVVVPLQPSMFDILATQQFLQELREEKHVRQHEIEVGVVGMRVDSRTKAAEQLHRFIDQLGLPVLGYLRNTQNYVQLAAHGLTLFDVAPYRVEKDLSEWQTLTDWLLK
ncbi:ParA family protein [Parvibium lacunae]|uniref:ParA family protein n=1 Tax=Parvibium lacunae TaxID=1888893 RepID=A0A368L7H9_9BURK|nr:ParA family protein [Parvibium lacunae]RCS59199.1 ParA family protein [Parvibium lacunae]